MLFLNPNKNRVSPISNAMTDDGHLSSISVSEDNAATNDTPNQEPPPLFSKWTPPGYLWRGLSVFVLAGQVITRIVNRKVYGEGYLFLVTPRVIASCLALPFLTLICFTVGMASSALLADGVYGISINIILDSAQRALKPWDIISAMIKSQVFGLIISVVSCGWGVTTLGGAKGVGESTTSAVVLSLVGIFIADFVLSYCFFQGAGDSLKNL